MSKFIPFILSIIVLSTITYAYTPLKQYDQYVYYGDDFKLDVHPGNYLLVKYENEIPVYLNDGKAFENNLFEIPYVNEPIPVGEYKILELKFGSNNEILDFYETSIILSKHRSCFSGSPQINCSK